MNSEKRRAERKPLSTEVQFYVDADIIKASSVDISDSGIRMTTHTPIRIRMRYEMDGRQHERVAELVWARRNADGNMDYGLQYLEDADTIDW